MRRALLVCIAFLMPLAFAVEPARAASLYVSDEAAVLSGSTERAIAELGRKLDDATRRPGGATGAQVAVVTVPSLEGESVETVALRRARAAGLGDRDADNGVLILVVTSERKLRIEVGYGLEAALPDSRCRRIIDEMLAPPLEAGAYDRGVWDAYRAVVERVADEAGVSVSSPYQPSAASPSAPQWDAASTWVCLGGLGFAAIFAGLAILFQRLTGVSAVGGERRYYLNDRLDSGGGPGGGSDSGGGGGFGGGGASGDY